MRWSLRTLTQQLAQTAGIVLCLPLAAHAACTRVIHVPVAATGLSVIVEGDTIKGIYPDLLRTLAAKDGCTVDLSAVPRARLEMLFETGRADVLIPATKTPRRDTHGIFIPLIHNRAMLISLQSARAPIRSAQELLEQPALKVALVRGFDYGQAYQDLLAALDKQGRVILEVDALSVARLLKAGTADATIMAPSILAGALPDDERVRDLFDRLRFEALRELPWGDSGAYLSNRSLQPQDKAALQAALERAARSGVVWKGFQQYYAPAILQGSIRPL
jgi:polar amino acid transport system substrate-binding protein